MPYNERSVSGGSDSAAAHTYPISRAFAVVVAVALVVLFALRHIYGAVTVQAGTS